MRQKVESIKRCLDVVRRVVRARKLLLSANVGLRSEIDPPNPFYIQDGLLFATGALTLACARLRRMQAADDSSCDHDHLPDASDDRAASAFLLGVDTLLLNLICDIAAGECDGANAACLQATATSVGRIVKRLKDDPGSLDELKASFNTG